MAYALESGGGWSVVFGGNLNLTGWLFVLFNARHMLTITRIKVMITSRMPLTNRSIEYDWLAAIDWLLRISRKPPTHEPNPTTKAANDATRSDNKKRPNPCMIFPLLTLPRFIPEAAVPAIRSAHPQQTVYRIA